MLAMQDKLDSLVEVSGVLGSGKRAILLFILYRKPVSYTEICNSFKRLGVKIGSSEVYKHLDTLMDKKYVAKKAKIYLVTLKGKTLVEAVEQISKIPPTVPKLRMVF